MEIYTKLTLSASTPPTISTFYTLPRELRQQILFLTPNSPISDNIDLQTKNHTPMCTWYFDKLRQCLDLQTAFPELAENVEFVIFKATKAVHDAFVYHSSDIDSDYDSDSDCNDDSECECDDCFDFSQSSEIRLAAWAHI